MLAILDAGVNIDEHLQSLLTLVESSTDAMTSLCQEKAFLSLQFMEKIEFEVEYESLSKP